MSKFSRLWQVGSVLALGALVALAAFALGRMAAEPTLRSLADARGLDFGVSVGGHALRDPRYGGAAAQHFSLLATENALKFGPVHPAADDYDFSEADAIIEFAEAHGMAVEAHVLVWQNQNPDWLMQRDWTRQELMAVLHEHIMTVVGHYRGRIKYWVVANEAVTPEGQLADNFWLQHIGADYIEMAFRWAHEADPQAILLYNDFAAEGLNPKSGGIYNLMKDLLAKGVPVHGVGLQMHVYTNSPPPPAEIAANMQRLNDLGLQVQVTEMDVRIRLPVPDGALEKQARVYADTLRVCLQAENCTAFILWGLTDAHSWIPYFYPGWGAALILDENYQPKPAYEALRRVFEEGELR